MEGELVGDPLGDPEGDSVGAALGPSVGTSVETSSPSSVVDVLVPVGASLTSSVELEFLEIVLAKARRSPAQADTARRTRITLKCIFARCMRWEGV